MKDASIIFNSLNSDFLLSSETRKYVELKFIRDVELLISERYSEQIFRCPVHLSIGQEAVAVGVCWNLKEEDKAMSTHRSHAHYLAKGGSLFRMFAELMGSKEGCCGGRGGSMHIFDKTVGFIGSVPIVGSSIPISSGLAMAEKLANGKNIVVSFVGDASLETGSFFETLNLASLKNLPLLIVIEDNGYSTYAGKAVRVSSERNTRTIIEGFGIPFFSGTGDTIDEVIELSKKAIAIVRTGKTVVVEFSTFRLLEHCGPNNDDHLGYRSVQEIESYKERDPVLSLSQAFNDEQIFSLNQAISKYVALIFEHALAARQDEFQHFQGLFPQ